MGRCFKKTWKYVFYLLLSVFFLTTEAIADDLADGIAYYKLGEYTKAFGVVKRFAERGDTDAQFLLSHMYQVGKGIDPDEVISGKWLLKAADEGHREAQYVIGQYYYQGIRGFEKNREEAVFWFEKAANQQHVQAQLMMGYCYFMGEGVPLNKDASLVWYKKAADLGNKEAIQYISNYHLENTDL